MKTFIKHSIAVGLITPLIVGAGLLKAPEAQAGDKEWATVGKILTGVVAANVIFDALPVHHDRHVVVHHTRIVRAPRRHHTVVVHHRRPTPRGCAPRWLRSHKQSHRGFPHFKRDRDHKRYRRGGHRDHDRYDRDHRRRAHRR
ncbi:MAG: hypothetical protein K9N51_13050 [Candidatus Pacebacteria bacterium]|nr:hypothetical protein [Candidatus Paceibacterota bacterium]